MLEPNHVNQYLSLSKLMELLERKHESEDLDFKLKINLEDRRGIVELAKDVLAMTNRFGGHIVVGVEDGSFEVRGVPAEFLRSFKDSSTLNSKLRRYCGSAITIYHRIHQLETTTETVSVILIYVPQADEVVLAQEDGSYPTDNGKQSFAFRKGDIYVRKADASTKMEQIADLAPLLRRGFTQQQKPIGAPLRNSSPRLPRKLNQQAKNPYDFTHVASSEVFKGRTEEIDRLLDNIDSGTHTAVFGLQRMGKTSLVNHAIMHELQKRPTLSKQVLFTSIDFQQNIYMRYGDVFNLFLGTIASLFKSEFASTKASRIIADFTGITTSSTISDKKLLFAPFAQALKELVGVASGKKIVLFLDEFSEWCRVIESNEKARKSNRKRTRLTANESLVDTDLMQFFSSLLRDSSLKDRIVFIFAVRPFMAEFDHQRSLQILKLTESITLYYLDDSSAKALIREPLSKIIPINDDAIDYLCKTTAGHPYLIQYILKKVVDTCFRKGDSHISLDRIINEETHLISEGPANEAIFRVLDSDYSVEDVLDKTKSNLGKGVLALIAKLSEEESGRWVGYKRIVDEIAKLSFARFETDTTLDQLVIDFSVANGTTWGGGSGSRPAG